MSKQAPDSARDIRSMVNTHILPAWGKRKTADIRPSDVDKLLAEVAKGRARPHKTTTKQKRVKPLQGTRPTPLRANRVGCTIRKMFNLAIRWEIRTDNPAAGFICNPETPRERFLDLKEIERLSKALADHPNQRFAEARRSSRQEQSRCLIQPARGMPEAARTSGPKPRTLLVSH